MSARLLGSNLSSNPMTSVSERLPEGAVQESHVRPTLGSTQTSTVATNGSGGSRRLFAALLGGGGLALFVASCVSNASNFLFHVMMSRILGPSTYGALGSLLGLITFVAIAVTALQAAVTQAVAERQTGARTLALRKHTIQVSIAGVGAFLIVAAAYPALDEFLHLSSPLPVILLGLFVAINLLVLLPQGVLLGQLSFRIVAAALVISSIVRLACGIALTEFGFGLDGAVAASVFGAVALLLVLIWPLRRQIWSVSGRSVSIRFNSAIVAVAALGGFSALVGVDVFLARHYLPASASGHYAAAATAARIALFLPSAIALIAFPKLAASHGTGAEARHVLATSLLAVGALGMLAAVAMILLPHLVIAVLFGSQYRSAAVVLPILALSAAGLGLVCILVYFHLARHSKRSLTAWFGVVLAVVMISIWHANPTTIAFAILGVTGATLVSLGVGVFAKRADESTLEIATTLCEREPDLDLSIVLPHFNSGSKVRTTIDDAINVLQNLGVNYEIIAVSDGSTDGSDESLVGLPDDIVRVIRLPYNQGKGQALRAGLAVGRGTYVGFIDGDGDLPVDQLASFVALVRSHHPDIVLGSKRHPMSDVVYPPIRRIYSWGYQLLVRMLFRLNVRDTQTGLKLIRRDVLAATLPRMLEKRFAFDLELLVVARRVGFRRFFEAPVDIRERFASTISPRAVWNMFVDTAAIFYRLHILHYYDRQPQPQPHSVTRRGQSPLRNDLAFESSSESTV